MASPILVNPLENAIVASRGRVDEGVDFGMGGGYLSAISYGRVTYSNPAAPGWPGGWIGYEITGVAGLDGAIIYYSEGISGLAPVGTQLTPGEGVCFCTPGGSIEIGFGSTNPPNTWARQYGGGYDQVNSTRAGILFNQLLAELHAPTGYLTGHPTGARPPYDISGTASPVGGVLTTGQLLTLYNPSTIIRHAFYRFGEYGRHASFQAALIRALVEASHFTTTEGID